jgi:dienelactone hydrolase
VFGHGFAMAWDAYRPIYDSLAGRGFVVALPRTEGSIIPAPSHNDFGKDLALVSERMVNLNTVSTSLFFQKLNGRRAIGGHSMGGGSTYLANQYTSGVNCYFTFAAAETNPSAISAAANMTAPSLVIAGSLDCVAPPSSNQVPIYNAISSPCKTYVSITGGCHCNFNSDNFNCNLGESTCSPSGGLNRATQLNYVRAIIIPYLTYFLKGDCSAWTQFSNLIGTASWLTSQNTCLQNLPLNPQVSGAALFCEGDSVTLTAQPAGFSYSWNTGSNLDSITIGTAGSYQFTASNGVCALTSPSFGVLSEPKVENASITASGPLSFCEGGAVTLTASPANQPVIWSTGAFSVSVSVSQTLDVWAFVGTPACGDTTDIVQVTQISYPNSVSMTVPSDSIFTGLPYTFSVTPEPGMTYEWISPFGLVVSGQGTPTAQIEFPYPGPTPVSCVISNENCPISVEENVMVFVNYSSMEEFGNGSRISVFPNPHQSVLFVSGAEAGSRWTIKDVTGKTLLTGLFSSDMSIQTDRMPGGTYCLEIFSKENRTIHRALIIKQ